MSRSDYAHYNEDADIMWWLEEGKFANDSVEIEDEEEGFFASQVDDEDTTYKIMRFFRNEDRNEVVATGKTLKEAQEWCDDPSTKNEDYFDGYTSE